MAVSVFIHGGDSVPDKKEKKERRGRKRSSGERTIQAECAVNNIQ